MVGHSYGGQIMTALGTNAPNAVGLVYVAAFGLDEGDESLGALLSQGPVTPALAHLFTDGRGLGWLSEEDFVEHFAADVDRPRARVMWAVQQALASSAFTDVMGPPAWKVAADLVPGRTKRRGAPARRRAAVRGADGGHHGRDPSEPRCDGVASHGGRSADRAGCSVGWGGHCSLSVRGRPRPSCRRPAVAPCRRSH